MSTPTDPSRDELRALRERAYGPAADIHDDPIALARLHELENAALAPAAPVIPPLSPTGPVPSMDASSLAETPAGSDADAPEHILDPADARRPELRDLPDDAAREEASIPETEGRGIPSPPDTGETTTDASARRPWWRRRVPLLWAGSVVAGMLVGVGLTLGVQALESGEVAVLSVDADAEWPSQMFGMQPANSLVFEEFHGLKVLAFSQAFGMGDVQNCLYVMSVEEQGNIGASGCGPDAFPASASLQVLRVSPAQLREAFEPGTALQFVLDGDRVHVYARSPVLVGSTP